MIFRSSQNLPSYCNLKYIKVDVNIWFKLGNSNSWLNAANKTKIHIRCEDITSTIITIEGTGIFNLDSNCEVHTDDNKILIPTKIITSKVDKDFAPKLNTSLKFQGYIKIANKISSNAFLYKENKKFKKNLVISLNDLHTMLEEKSEKETTSSILNYLYIISIMIIVISVGSSLLLLYYKIKNILHCKKKLEDVITPKVYEEIELNEKAASPPGKSFPKIM
uniref:Uncharacterized protein n=1 Tax=Sipha flava TaxID=143950 RepID=A0A2S2QYM9_9HEMI